jgi:hypothetical protein
MIDRALHNTAPFWSVLALTDIRLRLVRARKCKPVQLRLRWNKSYPFLRLLQARWNK